MNLVLLFPSDLCGTRATLRDHRFEHIRKVIRPQLGDTVTVGLLDGDIGEGVVEALNDHEVVLDVTYEAEPPPPIPAVLLLALPRPKSLFKSLQLATTMGVKEVHLFNASRVEKSFWQSRRLTPEAIREHLLIGLSQAKDTVVPTVRLHRLFAPFINDALPGIAQGAPGYIAHPSEDHQPCPRGRTQRTLLAVGPERGFIPHEVGQFRNAGFEPIALGPRILRVEQALPVFLAKMFD